MCEVKNRLSSHANFLPAFHPPMQGFRTVYEYFPFALCCKGNGLLVWCWSLCSENMIRSRNADASPYYHSKLLFTSTQSTYNSSTNNNGSYYLSTTRMCYKL